MLVSPESSDIADFVRVIGQKKSSQQEIEKNQEQIEIILCDGNLEKCKPYLEILADFIQEYPDFYTNAKFLEVYSASYGARKLEKLRNTKAGEKDRRSTKDAMLEKGYELTDQLYHILREHIFHYSDRHFDTYLQIFPELLKDIYAAELPLSQAHVHMIIESAIQLEKLYTDYKKVLHEACRLSGISPVGPIDTLALQQMINRKSDVNFYFWMQAGTEKILATHFRTLYRSDQFSSWLATQALLRNTSVKKSREILSLLKSESDIDEEYIRVLFGTLYGKQAGNEMVALSRDIYFNPKIDPVHVDLTYYKPAVGLHYEDGIIADTNIGGYYESGAYFFVYGSGDAHELEQTRSHEYAYYLHKNLWRHIHSEVSRRMVQAVYDEKDGEEIYIQRDFSPRGFSSLSPDWSYAQDELCAYLDVEIIPIALFGLIDNPTGGDEWLFGLMGLITEIYSILRSDPYPDISNKIIQIIRTSSSLSECSDRIKKAYFYSKTPGPRDRKSILGDFLDIPENVDTEIPLKNVSISRRLDGWIIVEDPHSQQLYKSVEDIPESIFS